MVKRVKDRVKDRVRKGYVSLGYPTYALSMTLYTRHMVERVKYRVRKGYVSLG